MVSTKDILTLFAYAAAQTAPPLSRLSGMTDVAAPASKQPTFPGENPPEHELEAWRLIWVATLREKHLLAFAEKADPLRLAEYRQNRF